MSEFRFIFGKKYVILKHYDTLFTKSCDGKPFVLVKFFAPMQQRIDFLSRDSFFIKKN
jgi:hypothetical protein